MSWLAGKSKDPYYSERPLVNRIRKYGISFQPTDEDYKKIKDLGGSDELIREIRNKAPQPVPKPKPDESLPVPPDIRFKTGLLTVDCQPAECIVLVNGGLFVSSTVGGTVSQHVLEGLATVSAVKTDYDSDKGQQPVDMAQNKPVRQEFKFTVSPAALARLGNNLFEQMIVALGGSDGLKHSEIVTGKGSLNSWVSGKLTPWSFSVFFDKRNKRKYGLSARNQKYEVTPGENTFTWNREPETRELESCLRWFQDYQIAKVIGRLQGDSFKKVVAELKPAEGQPRVIRAVSAGQTYSITLDPDNRPAEITLEAGGLDRGLKIQYSDYKKDGSSYYPKRLQVIQPDDSHTGVQVEFDTFNLGLPEKAGKPSKKGK
jgi:hypothetical protein